jgi:hypothetical protein
MGKSCARSGHFCACPKERSQHTNVPTRRAGRRCTLIVLNRDEAEGAVRVAESSGVLVGFVAGWIEETENISETSDSNRVKYIYDICVMLACAAADRHRTPKGNRVAFFRPRNRALADGGRGRRLRRCCLRSEAAGDRVSRRPYGSVSRVIELHRCRCRENARGRCQHLRPLQSSAGAAPCLSATTGSHWPPNP